MLRLVWLIPLLPLAGFFINFIVGRYGKLSERAVGYIACGTVLLSLVLTILAFIDYSGYAHAHEEKPYVMHLFEWLPGGLAQQTLGTSAGALATFSTKWGYQFDQRSLVMMFVVTFVGFWIHVFATGYMHGDKGFYRFFSYLNLFMFMMLVLVMGSNFLVMFVGWEGVGLCSYLLIGYYFDRQEAGDASKKAFVVNRIGDFGFALAVMGVFAAFGSLEFSELQQVVANYPMEALGAFGLFSWLALGLFIGASGKSAQIPLYIWLPDAMAGPTPVSALIHAATMVTAGVFMVVRTNFIFQRSPTMMLVVASVGCLTALVAATIGITQTDIKKVLAYSTVSQLGYMFLGAGVGAFVAAIFHVFTHAFFKALLFLGSGSVIHGMHHEQEMPKMGGLAKYMPITYKTMLIGWLAICGIIPFAGFWSKDEILGGAFASHQPAAKVLWIVGLFTAGLTAFYMSRLMALTFWGEERFKKTHNGHHEEPAGHSAQHSHQTEPGHHAPVEPHESPSSMTIPLMVLAAGSIVVGFLGIPHMSVFENWLEPVISTVGGRHEAPGLGEILALMAASLAVAGLGIFLGLRFYVKQPSLAKEWTQKLRPLYNLSFNKWYLDYLLDVKGVEAGKSINNALWKVDATVVDGGVNGTGWFTRLWARITGWWDKWVIDLAVNMTGWITRAGSLIFRACQTGFWQNYALVFTLGLFAILLYYEYAAIRVGAVDLFQGIKGIFGK